MEKPIGLETIHVLPDSVGSSAGPRTTMALSSGNPLLSCASTSSLSPVDVRGSKVRSPRNRRRLRDVWHERCFPVLLGKHVLLAFD